MSALRAFGDHIRQQSVNAGAAAGDAPQADAAPPARGGLGSTTTLSAGSPNPSLRGQKVTWTAEVKFSDGSPATGFVVFDASADGGLTELGRVALSNGKATVTASLFHPGKYTIKANYDDQGTDRGNVTGSHDEQQQEVNLPPLADLLKQNPVDPDLLKRAVNSELAPMDMGSLLDALTKLQKAGTLDTLLDNVANIQDRIGVASLTVQSAFDQQWRQGLAKLSDADRQAILQRTPKDVQTQYDLDKPKSDDDKEVEQEGVIAVGLDGAEVQAKVTWKSPLTGSLGETEFTIHVGPGGKLKQFELDVTAIKQKLEKMGPLANMLELETTISLNATVDNKAVSIGKDAGRVIFGAVQVQAKGEIAAQFKNIPVLNSVTLKLSVTAGSGGFSGQVAIEIKLPKILQ